MLNLYYFWVSISYTEKQEKIRSKSHLLAHTTYKNDNTVTVKLPEVDI